MTPALKAFAVSSAVVLSLASPSMAENASSLFDTLGATKVDMLTYGLHALQTDLNLAIEDSCPGGCGGAHMFHTAKYSPTKPKSLPPEIQWLPEGMIVIENSVSREGDDDSMSNEEGCTYDLDRLSLAEKVPSSQNFAAYFLPYRQFAEAPDQELIANIRKHIILYVSQSHTKNSRIGIIEKSIWYGCARNLDSRTTYQTGHSYWVNKEQPAVK